MIKLLWQGFSKVQYLINVLLQFVKYGERCRKRKCKRIVDREAYTQVLVKTSSNTKGKLTCTKKYFIIWFNTQFCSTYNNVNYAYLFYHLQNENNEDVKEKKNNRPFEWNQSKTPNGLTLIYCFNVLFCWFYYCLLLLSLLSLLLLLLYILSILL